jgi:hypothetical protein
LNLKYEIFIEYCHLLDFCLDFFKTRVKILMIITYVFRKIDLRNRDLKKVSITFMRINEEKKVREFYFKCTHSIQV